MAEVTVVTMLVGGFAVLALLVLSAFFSVSETAVFSLERHRLDSLLEDGSEPRAWILERLREDPHRLLVTLLVGNTIANVAMTAIAAVLLAIVFPPIVAILAATALMSTLILVFGEITPKSFGIANAESLSLGLSRPISLLERALFPAVLVFDVVSRPITRLTGSAVIEEPSVTREGIESLLRTGERVGVIEEAERDMVEGVFDLSSTTAREVMVPRVNVIGVDIDAPLDDVLDVCSSNRLTRVPVYRETLDHVVGLADIRDVELALRNGMDLSDVLLPTIQVPDSREIDGLLTEMQDNRVPMVVVLDEFGEFEGIITVEDILEEIVGEIFEVGEERLIHPTEDGLLVNGEVTVNEVNEALDASLPTEGEFETVAGLINTELGRLGDVEDTVSVAGVSLTVDEIDGNRIRRVRVRHDPDPDEPESEDPGTGDDGSPSQAPDLRREDDGPDAGE